MKGHEKPEKTSAVSTPWWSLPLMSQIDKHSQGRVDFDNNGVLGENEFLRLMRMQKDWRFLMMETDSRCQVFNWLCYRSSCSAIIHPASRGVAAHTAGLFWSVRGAKGGFPPWGLPKLRIFTSPPVGAPQAREFSLFPPVGAPQAREFSLFPPWGSPS